MNHFLRGLVIGGKLNRIELLTIPEQPPEIIWTCPHANSGAGLSNSRAVPITGKEYRRQVLCPSR